MAGVSVNRWTRYGKERLYVMDGELRLGWYDLVTDELHVEDTARGLERAEQGLHPVQLVGDQIDGFLAGVRLGSRGQPSTGKG